MGTKRKDSQVELGFALSQRHHSAVQHVRPSHRIPRLSSHPPPSRSRQIDEPFNRYRLSRRLDRVSVSYPRLVRAWVLGESGHVGFGCMVRRGS